ncbi:hypothetical protein [Reyranella sp.]|uniref:hypothetical protein n=1 Tax=Reyranella sp. TaxID=1929291 RepID=UPI003BAD957E
MNAIGRPTAYRPGFCKQARNYCLLGATNEELGAFFGVTRRTIDNWIAGQPEFEAAVKSGRVAADAKVASGLYARATGFERKVKRTALYRGEPKDFETNVYFPPDTQACIFWLRNRRRATWRGSPGSGGADDDGIDDIARLEAASESVRRSRASPHDQLPDGAPHDEAPRDDLTPGGASHDGR